MFKNSLKTLWANLFFAISAYLIHSMIARFAGVEEYGRYALAISIVAWLELFSAEAFMNPIVSAVLQGSKQSLRNTCSWQIRIASIIALLLVVITLLIPEAYSDHSLKTAILIGALDILPFAYFAQYTALLNAEERFEARMWASMSYSAGKLVFMGSLTYLYQSAGASMAGMVVASFLSALFSLYLVKQKPLFSRQILSESGSTNTQRGRTWHSVLLSSSQGIMLNGDLWLIKLCGFSVADIGIYSAAQNLARTVLIAGTSVIPVLSTKVAEATSFCIPYRENPSFRKLIKWSLLLLVFIALVLSVFRNTWISLLYGANFSDAAYYLAFLPVSYVFLTVGITQMRLIYFTDDHSYSARAAMLACATFIVVGYAVLSTFGIEAAISLQSISGITLVVLCSRHLMCRRGR